MKTIHYHLRYLLVGFILLSLSACGGGNSSSTNNNTPPIQSQRGDLVSVSKISTYTVDSLKSLSTANTLFTGYQNNMFYAVDVYKIVYWTVDPVGTLLKASGMLAIPQNGQGTSNSLLNVEHGTIFLNADAPSNSLGLQILAAMMASTNFIVTAPDFIGYGTAATELHPYLYARNLADTTVDLLRATKQYLSNQHIALNGKLFLSGYSEGGYASVATHRAIQQQYSSEFTVTADVAGDGPYDLSTTADTLLSSPTLPFAPYVAFIFKAYDTIYNWNRISDFFQPRFVNAVNADFDGTHSATQIEADLTNVTADLFNPTFLSNYLSTGEPEIKARLAENNVYDWTPQAPVRFYHGVDDITVPYTNATTAQVTMSGNGASDVAVINCTTTGGVPADHGNCAFPYFEYALGYFLTFIAPP